MLFRCTVYHAIYKGTDCRLQELGVHADSLHCENSDSLSNAVYRATIYSTPNHSVQYIHLMVEQLVSEGGGLSSDVVLRLDSACPVSVQLDSQPLCRGASDEKPTKNCPNSNHVQTNSIRPEESVCEEAVVTVPVLVSALVAELFLLVCVLLLTVVIALLVQRKRYVKYRGQCTYS